MLPGEVAADRRGFASPQPDLRHHRPEWPAGDRDRTPPPWFGHRGWSLLRRVVCPASAGAVNPDERFKAQQASGADPYPRPCWACFPTCDSVPSSSATGIRSERHTSHVRQEMKLLLPLLAIGFMIGCRQKGTVYRRLDVDPRAIAAALLMYHQTTGEYPSANQGLPALIDRPVDLPPEAGWKQILDEVPKDPWGNEYHYSPPSGANPPTFEIRCLGRDGTASEDDIVTVFRAGSIERIN